MSTEDQRIKSLTTWISTTLPTDSIQLESVSGDASFRRYFRIKKSNPSYIAVDAPPEKENCEKFISITNLLSSYQVRVPKIFHYDLANGFMLLENFGDKLLLHELTKASVNTYYAQALHMLLQLHKVPSAALPPYDQKLLLQEMQLFNQWYIGTHLHIQLSQTQQDTLNSAYRLLIDSALQQPQVFVHRDYHSRNLMLLENDTVGTIDYQDAVHGPFSYDLVSLLRDCYISWPDEQVYQWTSWFNQHQQQATVSDQQFNRWFDLMGIQRHLKAVGIFSRLHHRDSKSCYLDDIPRTLEYIVRVSAKYPELKPFHQLITQQL